MERRVRRWWALSAYGLLLALVNALLFGSIGQAMADDPVRLLVLGDSLTAGYGLAANESFPSKLEVALKAKGYDISVINAGVSGDTSADGLARLDWVLGDKPQFAIVELGSNDMLRGVDPARTTANLDAILAELQHRNIKILLAGMLAARNLGQEYDTAFDGIFPKLSANYKIPLYPFFLDGVALHPELTQSDGMHPTAAGVDIMVQKMMPSIEQWLGKPGKAPT